MRKLIYDELLNDKYETLNYYKDGKDVLLVCHHDMADRQGKIYVRKDATHGLVYTTLGTGILGGDDRAGIAFARRLTKETGCGLLITHGEESYGEGSRALISDNQTFIKSLKKYKVMIGIDRQGYDEVVYYANSDAKLMSIMKKYGYNKNIGSFSDVSLLGPATGVGSCNISACYMYQHTKKEIILLEKVDEAYDKMKNMVLGFMSDNTFYKNVEVKYARGCDKRFLYYDY